MCDHDHYKLLSVIMTITNFWVWWWPLQYCCVCQCTNNFV